MATQQSLTSLAEQITELTKAFTAQLKEGNVAEPSFAVDSPTRYDGLDVEMFMTRQKLLDSITDMWFLTQGPSESIFNYAHTAMPDAATLNILNYFDFWSAVPIDGSATYAEIATKTRLPEDVVNRVLQHAINLRIFSETADSPAKVQHNSRSAALAKSSGLQALVSSIMDDAGAPMMVMHEALQRYTRDKPALSQNVEESAFSLLHKTGIYGNYNSSWQFIENDGTGDQKGWRQRKFVEFMKYIKGLFHLEDIVLGAQDWAKVGKATVVDVGGSAGHDAFQLARSFPELTLVVQDLDEVKPVFESSVPDDVKDRVSFVVHDFFQPQPVQGDIYLLKMILHDWPDESAVKIIQALRPGLKHGARVILFEYIGNQDEAGKKTLPRTMQQMGTATDVRLMALFNSKERQVDAWKDIFTQADERFAVVNVKADPVTFFAVVEAEWRDQ